MAENEKRYTLDDEALEGGLEAFIAKNDFTEQELAEIAALEVGDDMILGGGAAPDFVLKRVA